MPSHVPASNLILERIEINFTRTLAIYTWILVNLRWRLRPSMPFRMLLLSRSLDWPWPIIDLDSLSNHIQFTTRCLTAFLAKMMRRQRLFWWLWPPWSMHSKAKGIRKQCSINGNHKIFYFIILWLPQIYFAAAYFLREFPYKPCIQLVLWVCCTETTSCARWLCQSWRPMNLVRSIVQMLHISRPIIG